MDLQLHISTAPARAPAKIERIALGYDASVTADRNSSRAQRIPSSSPSLLWPLCVFLIYFLQIFSFGVIALRLRGEYVCSKKRVR